MIRIALLIAASALIGTALDIGNDLDWLARAWAILIGGSVMLEYALQAGEIKHDTRPRLAVRVWCWLVDKPR